MTDERKDLPPVNSPNFLEKVREALSVYLGNRGGGLDRGITVRDLTDAGLVELRKGFGSGGAGGTRNPIGGPGSLITDNVDVYEPDLTPPPTPTGFTATAGITNLILECDPQTYTQGHGHAKSKLYGATYTTGPLPVFANAVVITEFAGNVASHATNPATTWHLWLTWVTKDGVESITPAGGTNGVVTRTGEDVALLLEALTGEITESQLYADLGSRIDLIDTPTTGLVDSLAAAKLRLNAVDTPVTGILDRLTATNSALTTAAADATAALDSILDINASIAELQGTPEYAAGTTYVVGNKVKYNGNIYQATTTTTGNLPTNVSFWTNIGAYVDSAALAAIVGGHTTDITTLNGQTTALTTQSNLLASQVGTSLSGLSLEQTTRSSNDSALSSQIVTLAASTAVGAAGLELERQVRSDATGSLAQQVTTLVASMGGNTAGLTVEQQVRADSNLTLSNQLTTLTAATGTNIAGLTVERQVSSDANGALAQQVVNLGAQTASSTAALTVTQQALTTADAALASQVSTLAAQTGANLAGITAAQLAVATTDVAVASQVTTLQSSVAGNTAAIQTEATTRATQTGELYAQYTVKLDVGGKVSGYGLASSSTSSEFAIRADRFYIAPPETGGGTATQIIPFAVQATATTINGVAVPAGVYINDAYIKNGTITNAKIGDAAIDDAKIANLDATKITTGFFSADRIEAGSITASKIDTKGLDIKDALGNVIFSSGSQVGGGNLLAVGSFGQGFISSKPMGWNWAGSTTSTTQYLTAGPVGNGPYASASFTSTTIKGLTTSSTIHSQGGVRGGFVLGRKYVISFYARNNFSAGPLFYPASPAFASYTTVSAPTSSSSWQRYVYKVTCTTANAAGELTIWNSGTGSSGGFSLGAVMVEEGDILTAYSETTIGPITSGNASTWIADAAIGTAQIDTLNASVITAGTITTDRLIANAATAVSGGVDSYLTQTRASATPSFFMDVNPVLTITTSGAPLNCFFIFNGSVYLATSRTGLNFQYSIFVINNDNPGTFVAQTTRHANANTYGGQNRADTSAGMNLRLVLPAGTYTIKAEVSIGNLGGGNFITGDIARLWINGIAMENKV